MAGKKFSSFPTLKQPKFPVDEALYNLNVAFESIAANIERLDNDKAMLPETLRLYRVHAETLRSAINHRVTGVLFRREERDWGHFGKQAIEIEERQKQGKEKKS